MQVKAHLKIIIAARGVRYMVAGGVCSGSIQCEVGPFALHAVVVYNVVVEVYILVGDVGSVILGPGNRGRAPATLKFEMKQEGKQYDMCALPQITQASSPNLIFESKTLKFYHMEGKGKQARPIPALLYVAHIDEMSSLSQERLPNTNSMA